ncbi:hypothetical protein Hdeb2414_s0286g00857821 [Helianthus debilis subsp. tardiflorus]
MVKVLKKFNQGNGFSNRGGRKPFQRGGGRFRGGRSGPRSGYGLAAQMEEKCSFGSVRVERVEMRSKR